MEQEGEGMKLIFKLDDGPVRWRVFLALLAADLLIAAALMWALTATIISERA